MGAIAHGHDGVIDYLELSGHLKNTSAVCAQPRSRVFTLCLGWFLVTLFITPTAPRPALGALRGRGAGAGAVNEGLIKSGRKANKDVLFTGGGKTADSLPLRRTR